MLRIFINTDLEGVSGVGRAEYIKGALNRPDLVAEARKLLAEDINACVAGCFDAGADVVTVRDGHGGGGNLKRRDIDDRANFIDGPMLEERFKILKEYDAFMQVGSHAMAGTANAILEHSFSSASYQNCWLNGAPIGEIGVLAYAAAEYNVPCILVTGDDKACAEARAQMPEIVTAEVKKAYSCFGGFFPPLAVTHKLIHDKAVEAITAFQNGTIPVYKPTYPCTFRVELMERGQVPHKEPYKIIDARTYEVTKPSVEQVFLQMW
ncbi:MAG: M55 family metallopeptidase [Victivallales bacterium]|nr:M55 family metallopeptidase [Victivallales bacterium]